MITIKHKSANGGKVLTDPVKYTTELISATAATAEPSYPQGNQRLICTNLSCVQICFLRGKDLRCMYDISVRSKLA